MNKREKKKRFNRILKGIKEVRIQGAKNIAKKALYAYSLIPGKRSRKRLLSARPTEPLLEKVLDQAEKNPYNVIIDHLEKTQDKINKSVLKLVKNNEVIFTHCHSSTVTQALIYAKNHRKKFEVYNTETRPLFQGRRTTLELKKAKIKVTQFVDSAAMIALTRRQGTRGANKFFLGADALSKKGVVNKVGSGMFSKIAKANKIPLYIITDSWKFSSKNIEMEKRGKGEVWKNIAKRLHIKIVNPAFEFISKKDIKAVVSELGILSYDKFLKKV